MTAGPRIPAFLGSWLIRVLGRSWRVRVFGEEHLAVARRDARPVIHAFWHSRFLALTYTHRDRSGCVLASQHRDGYLMAETARFLGYRYVLGSSTRGGVGAIRALVDELRRGFDLGITVDGPTGPKELVKPGALEIAKLSGCAVVPIVASAKQHWTFRSWDRFQVPKPFASVRVCYGEPVTVPPDAGPEELEASRAALQRILTTLTRENDDAVAQPS